MCDNIDVSGPKNVIRVMLYQSNAIKSKGRTSKSTGKGEVAAATKSKSKRSKSTSRVKASLKAR